MDEKKQTSTQEKEILKYYKRFRYSTELNYIYIAISITTILCILSLIGVYLENNGQELVQGMGLTSLCLLIVLIYNIVKIQTFKFNMNSQKGREEFLSAHRIYNHSKYEEKQKKECEEAESEISLELYKNLK